MVVTAVLVLAAYFLTNLMEPKESTNGHAKNGKEATNGHAKNGKEATNGHAKNGKEAKNGKKEETSEAVNLLAEYGRAWCLHQFVPFVDKLVLGSYGQARQPQTPNQPRSHIQKFQSKEVWLRV